MQVVANQKENISPADTSNSITPSPPGERRNGMVTRAANAKKHPGFLALDDEDLKAMKKKDEAASRRQAKAEQKKTDRARLLANTDRIAAFEDDLCVQHEHNVVNAARPASRAGQKKAVRPVAPAEPIPDALAKSVVPAEELVESDASHADDVDYTPSSAESESEAAMVRSNLTSWQILSPACPGGRWQ